MAQDKVEKMVVPTGSMFHAMELNAIFVVKLSNNDSFLWLLRQLDRDHASIVGESARKTHTAAA